MAGSHTLAETESQVDTRLAHMGMQLDFEALAVVSNLFRAAGAVRNHLERNVLSASGLSWTAFVVLWVTWIWEPVETRDVAEESGISKATLTGVLKTLEKSGLVTRERSGSDGRLVLVSMTPAGRELMESLFPAFNRQEVEIVSGISPARRGDFAEMLRQLAQYTEAAAGKTPSAPNTRGQQD